MVKKLLFIISIITCLLLFYSLTSSKSEIANAQTVDCNSYYQMPNCFGNESICGVVNGQQTYCTRIAACGVNRCLPPKSDGESCLDVTECQPSSSRTCAVAQCQSSGRSTTATCCPAGKFWCPSTNSCTDQNSTACPCATDGTVTRATATPTQTQSNDPSCPSSGVKSTTYDTSGCISSFEAKSVTITCNDGAQKTYSSFTGRCDQKTRLAFNVSTFCNSHKTCPTATPTLTPTPSERELACGKVGDIDGNGKITRNDSLVLLQVLSGSNATDEQKMYGDVDGNGNLEIADTLAIDRYIAGLDSSFIACQTLSPLLARPLACDTYGDINSDQKIKADDWNSVKQMAADLGNYNASQKRNADLNGSNNVNASDVGLIKDYLLGSSNSFPVCSKQITCDPVADGVIDDKDFMKWDKEYGGGDSTPLSDCFHPDGKVDIRDFQAWKDIFFKRRNPI